MATYHVHDPAHFSVHAHALGRAPSGEFSCVSDEEHDDRPSQVEPAAAAETGHLRKAICQSAERASPGMRSLCPTNRQDLRMHLLADGVSQDIGAWPTRVLHARWLKPRSSSSAPRECRARRERSSHARNSAALDRVFSAFKLNDVVMTWLRSFLNSEFAGLRRTAVTVRDSALVSKVLVGKHDPPVAL